MVEFQILNNFILACVLVVEVHTYIHSSDFFFFFYVIRNLIIILDCVVNLLRNYNFYLFIYLFIFVEKDNKTKQNQ